MLSTCLFSEKSLFFPFISDATVIKCSILLIHTSACCYLPNIFLFGVRHWNSNTESLCILWSRGKVKVSSLILLIAVTISTLGEVCQRLQLIRPLAYWKGCKIRAHLRAVISDVTFTVIPELTKTCAMGLDKSKFKIVMALIFHCTFFILKLFINNWIIMFLHIVAVLKQVDDEMISVLAVTVTYIIWHDCVSAAVDKCVVLISVST